MRKTTTLGDNGVRPWVLVKCYEIRPQIMYKFERLGSAVTGWMALLSDFGGPHVSLRGSSQSVMRPPRAMMMVRSWRDNRGKYILLCMVWYNMSS